MTIRPGQFVLAGGHERHATNVFVCSSSVQRLRGLLGREELLVDNIFWLYPCSSIHTCFMKSAIDVVYLDELHRVIKLVSSLLPWGFSNCRSAFSVLELAEGHIDVLKLNVGDQFQCEA